MRCKYSAKSDSGARSFFSIGECDNYISFKLCETLKYDILYIVIVIWGKYIMKKEQHTHFDLYTEAGERLKGVSEVWTQYPRPQMVRDNWQSLNGIWELDGKPVRVPFPPESLLAEYSGEIKEHMLYTKRFAIEAYDANKRVLLHFGAVDQLAEVYLNGTYLGKHEGGYLPFTFDVTSVIQEKENELIVKVTDELNQDYPYGKQCKARGGMWYTPTSGIWQSVWLEQVPKTYISDVKITTDLRGVQLAVQTVGEVLQEVVQVSIRLHTGEEYTTRLQGTKDYIDLSKIVLASGEMYQPQLWDTEHPYLYTMTVQAGEDVVESYFGLRTIEIKEIQGVKRVCLNGCPIFMHGVLDQGYYSDGIMTPAEEAEYERDILRMKELGLNMLRKHIKIEPEWFYYYCDKQGMLVMQDMVSNGVYNYLRDTVLPTIGFQRKKDSGKGMTAAQKQIFEAHMLETLELLHNHPSIVAYTIFNEGWGQFESDRMYALAKRKDPTRLYDATSGWFAQLDNDFDSVHIYFGLKKPKVKERPVFLSEFGGYSYLVPEHIYSSKNYGYGTCKSPEELFKRIEARYEELVLPYIEAGLCGSVYTQVSDVEDEINGFYTYDRKVCKVKQQVMKKLADRIYANLKEK